MLSIVVGDKVASERRCKSRAAGWPGSAIIGRERSDTARQWSGSDGYEAVGVGDRASESPVEVRDQVSEYARTPDEGVRTRALAACVIERRPRRSTGGEQLRRPQQLAAQVLQQPDPGD